MHTSRWVAPIACFRKGSQISACQYDLSAFEEGVLYNNHDNHITGYQIWQHHRQPLHFAPVLLHAQPDDVTTSALYDPNKTSITACSWLCQQLSLSFCSCPQHFWRLVTPCCGAPAAACEAMLRHQPPMSHQIQTCSSEMQGHITFRRDRRCALCMHVLQPSAGPAGLRVAAMRDKSQHSRAAHQAGQHN